MVGRERQRQPHRPHPRRGRDFLDRCQVCRRAADHDLGLVVDAGHDRPSARRPDQCPRRVLPAGEQRQPAGADGLHRGQVECDPGSVPEVVDTGGGQRGDLPEAHPQHGAGFTVPEHQGPMRRQARPVQAQLQQTGLGARQVAATRWFGAEKPGPRRPQPPLDRHGVDGGEDLVRGSPYPLVRRDRAQQRRHREVPLAREEMHHRALRTRPLVPLSSPVRRSFPHVCPTALPTTGVRPGIGPYVLKICGGSTSVSLAAAPQVTVPARSRA